MAHHLGGTTDADIATAELVFEATVDTLASRAFVVTHVLRTLEAEALASPSVRFDLLLEGLVATGVDNGQYRLRRILSTTFVVRYSHPTSSTLDREFTFMRGTEGVDLDTRLAPNPTPPAPAPNPTPTPPISAQARNYVRDLNQNSYGRGRGIVRWTNFPIRVWADAGFRSQGLRDAMSMWESATAGRVRFSVASGPSAADVVFDLSGEGVPAGACGVEGPRHGSDFVFTSGFGHYLNEPRCAPNGEWKIGLAHGLGHILGLSGHTPSGSDVMGNPISNWNMSAVLSEVMTWIYSVPPGTAIP